MKNNKLIFDLGFHMGEDTDFYLKKGFDVVALEADPYLVRRGKKKFCSFIKKGQLVLLNEAVTEKLGVVKFYVNQKRKDWSSCNKLLAEIDGSSSKMLTIRATTFVDLCGRFGVPYYAKVDVEGNDPIVAQQLSLLKRKPKYVSFETSKQYYVELFTWLYVSGYKKFQLINQLKNPERELPHTKMSGEGKQIYYRFSGYSSGLFGKDLPARKWLTYDETLSRYMKYKELKIVDNQELALGWLDLHARL